jgi:DNA polymerase-1
MDSVGKVHGSINQTEATTGRMSITKPALQTLPKKDKRIRGIFEPSEGFRLWFMDLDQIEYRLLAHYAKATDLIQAIKDGMDIHLATAMLIFNKKEHEITDEERQSAKTINFSLVYGQGDDATAASLKVRKSEAVAFKYKYFASIPEIQPFIRTVHQVVKTRGFVKNWYSRRRRLTADQAYKAPNALIQGCAADYIKSKLVLMYKYLMAHKFKSRLINVVHDEILPEIHHSESFLAPKLRWLMSDFTTFRVPITAGAEYSDENWGAKQTPEEDIGFAELTEDEMNATLSFNVFDGSAFDFVA